MSEEYKDDTIPVREDEKFDVDKIAEYLQDKLPGETDPSNLSVRQFWGGAANLTYLLDYGSVEYVLRRPPLGPVAESAHDMEREYDVLSVLYEKYPYAPRAYHFCDDPEVMDAPFFIMDRKEGIVIRKEFPSQLSKDSDLPRRMSEELVDKLVEFHKVNYHDLGLSELGKPKGFITRQIKGWYKRWNKAKLKDNPQMDQMYEWLLEHEPETTDYTLVHNDYKLDNVMYDFDNPDTIVGVLDWDMCTLGDPFSDLGALLTYWVQPTDPPYLKEIAQMPTEDLRFLTRDEIVKRYLDKSGRSTEHINFYHALGLFRLTVIIAQIYIRYVNGQTQDERFAGLGDLIPHVIKACHDAAEGELNPL